MHEGHRERLRDAYLERGLEGMADHNILELLLTYAIPRRDVNPLAHRLMDTFGSLFGVLSAGTQELMRVEGVGESTAVFLSLMHGMTRRVLMDTFSDRRGRIALGVPETACRYAIGSLMNERYEAVRILCLDVHMNLISDTRIAGGTLTHVAMEPRNIIEHALLKKAAYLMPLHNHPSGNPLPSEPDLKAARALTDSAEPLGIEVIDQLIVGGNAVYSFRYQRVFLCPSNAACTALTPEEYQAELAASGAGGCLRHID